VLKTSIIIDASLEKFIIDFLLCIRVCVLGMEPVGLTQISLKVIRNNKRYPKMGALIR